MTIKSMSAVRVGDRLPELQVEVTAKTIIMGATGSRDWQPIHHDRDYARSQAGLPDIIMNNYTQAGWLSRYVSDWAGSEARVSRLRFAMKKPICPGGKMVFRGRVKGLTEQAGCIWFDLAITISVAAEVVTESAVQVVIAAENSPWSFTDNAWADLLLAQGDQAMG
ncbi:MaoC/PaaZ C-terminal domain-containing protein [Spongiibacter marinus]|uniref:MaoC/PaaZ C-terminal domain-containing protein n=1 Tax=Spongiibacter marinus TaxID=354246 RepID=UPI001961E58D|nr:MaoC/PaaZ C-terminal domain-containing protein [Spongiibacter marinus]MBM7422959.1 acyl dehydratase [Spongiibacter marinus]